MVSALRFTARRSDGDPSTMQPFLNARGGDSGAGGSLALPRGDANGALGDVFLVLGAGSLGGLRGFGGSDLSVLGDLALGDADAVLTGDGLPLGDADAALTGDGLAFGDAVLTGDGLAFGGAVLPGDGLALGDCAKRRRS